MARRRRTARVGRKADEVVHSVENWEDNGARDTTNRRIVCRRSGASRVLRNLIVVHICNDALRTLLLCIRLRTFHKIDRTILIILLSTLLGKLMS